MVDPLGGRVAITFMSGPLDGKTLDWPYPVGNNEFVLTIGRREGCDIVLAYDSQVSRLHARVIFEPGLHTFYLEDTGSRNGTYVGNNRVDGRVPLKPGILFRVGRTSLRLEPMRGKPQEVRDDDQDNTQF
jgi:pSer/pThr/pTyr-binding forkhead associated (FHA) protein